MPTQQTALPSHPFTRRQLVFGGVGLALSGGFVASVFAADSSQPAIHGDPPGATPCASPQASPGATPMGQASIRMTTALRFDPVEIRIKVGDTITWFNVSDMPHTATCDPYQNPVAAAHPEYIKLPEDAKPWGSEVLMPGDCYAHTFDVPGTYEYICIPHVLSGMRGRIEVEE